ncbi:kallikrein-4-like [Nycticebus coucang]|uniref:kallikrein-4-like n=1 Tax=Nycticebus coucang TaxID=9470 RepID=UPI00234C1F2B|nr:kallikrein-4-like [Nycticebus coucang]
MTTVGSPWTWVLGCLVHFVTGNAILPLGAVDNLTESLIVHGAECRPHSQPWQVAIVRNARISCGGVLVHPQWVLSAAHCYRSSYTIKLGRHNLYAKREPGSRTMKATFSVKHPKFKKKPKCNDLMLIKLKKPVTESASIRTINIAPQCPAPGTTCVISGWGRLANNHLPRVLQCANVLVETDESCKAFYPDAEHSSVFCAANRNKGESACKGDSGGPLVCGNFLQGIVSAGKLPCHPLEKPNLYTKVCKFSDWIQQTIQDN